MSSSVYNIWRVNLLLLAERLIGPLAFSLHLYGFPEPIMWVGTAMRGEDASTCCLQGVPSSVVVEALLWSSLLVGAMTNNAPLFQT